MKRVKPVYFHDQRGFLLTFGPEDDELFRWATHRTSDQIREIFGIHRFADIQAAAGKDRVRSWMRERLRSAMQGELRDFRPEATTVPPRGDGWPERDRAIAPRVERLLETWAPEAVRVLDPFAGSGLYPMVVSQRDVEAFWCEISPVQRFLTVTRFRALYREDTERRRLADEMLALAESLPQQIESDIVSAEGSGATLTVLRRIADRGEWTTSGISRDLFRAAIVSLLADGELLDEETIGNELRRHARYIASQKPMRTFPTLLTDDAGDLGSMRSVGADVLLTNPPSISARDAFSAAAEDFLSIDAAAERKRAVEQRADVPRGRGTSLHLEHATRELVATADLLADTSGARTVVDGLVAIVKEIDEPGKAAIAARYFAGLVRTSAAVEHHLAPRAVAIVDVADSWFAGRLLRNIDIVRDLLAASGFDEIATESTPVRLMADAVRKEHRVIVMRRGARPSRPAAGWAAWA